MTDSDFMAKLAFEAYSNAVGGTNVAGYPIPEWEALGTKVRAGWIAAADAVTECVLLPETNDDPSSGDY